MVSEVAFKIIMFKKGTVSDVNGKVHHFKLLCSLFRYIAINVSTFAFAFLQYGKSGSKMHAKDWKNLQKYRQHFVEKEYTLFKLSVISDKNRLEII